MAKPTALAPIKRLCGERLRKLLDQTSWPLLMIAPRRLILLLIFVAIPLIEIAVLIKVGQLIGVLPTVLIVIGTAILGLGVIRGQGFSVVARASRAVAEGQTPIAPVVDGAFVMTAGVLLITPGLVADTIGLVLLVPFLRRIIARWLVGGVVNSSRLHVMVFGDEPAQSEPEERAQRERETRDGTIIDGEFRRIDESEPRDRPNRPRR